MNGIHLSIGKMWLLALTLMLFNIALVMHFINSPVSSIEQIDWDFRISELRELEADRNVAIGTQNSQVSAVMGSTVTQPIIKDFGQSSTWIEMYFSGNGTKPASILNLALPQPASPSLLDQKNGQIL